MKPFKEALSKQMSRQEFLKLFGVALLGIFGVSNFLSYFLRSHNQSQPQEVAKAPSSNGFGSRTFGS